MTTNSKGILAVISGFSGAGKGTVTKRIVEKYPGYALSISVTSRDPRPGEVNGREYFFKTRKEIEEMIREDQLIEYAEYVKNYYGTPRAYVMEKLSEGFDVILEIEIQGAAKVRKQFPDSVLVFVTPPSFSELRDRLRNRGSESEEVIRQRMECAVKECGYIDDYDYIAINEKDKAEECVDKIHELIRSEHLKTVRNSDFVKELKSEAERS